MRESKTNAPIRRRASTLGRVAVVFAATLHLTGCYKTVMQPRVAGPMPDSIIVSDEGAPYVLHRPEPNGTAIVGWRMLSASDSAVVAVSRDVEVRKLAILRTIGLGYLSLALTVGIACAIQSAADGGSCIH